MAYWYVQFSSALATKSCLCESVRPRENLSSISNPLHREHAEKLHVLVIKQEKTPKFESKKDSNLSGEIVIGPKRWLERGWIEALSLFYLDRIQLNFQSNSYKNYEDQCSSTAQVLFWIQSKPPSIQPKKWKNAMINSNCERCWGTASVYREQ